jgi:hypothetical protein
MRIAMCVVALIACAGESPPPEAPARARAEIPKPPQGTTYYRIKGLDPGFEASSKLLVGDIILRLNGRPIYARYGGEVRDWLPELVHQLGSEAIVVTVLRDSQLREFTLHAQVDRDAVSEDGSPRYRIGIVVDRVDYLPIHEPRGFYK